MDRRHRQKPPGWTTGRSFLLFVALALAAAFIACARDLPDLGPTFAPLQTATPTTSPSTESSTRAVFGNVSDDEHVGRQEVRVREAWLESPDTLVLSANTCNENPEVSLWLETDEEVQVLMRADAYPFRQSYPDCLEPITVQLQAPLGDRVVVDQHTGKVVSVTQPQQRRR